MPETMDELEALVNSKAEGGAALLLLKDLHDAAGIPVHTELWAMILLAAFSADSALRTQLKAKQTQGYYTPAELRTIYLSLKVLNEAFPTEEPTK